MLSKKKSCSFFSVANLLPYWMDCKIGCSKTQTKWYTTQKQTWIKIATNKAKINYWIKVNKQKKNQFGIVVQVYRFHFISFHFNKKIVCMVNLARLDRLLWQIYGFMVFNLCSVFFFHCLACINISINEFGLWVMNKIRNTRCRKSFGWYLIFFKYFQSTSASSPHQLCLAEKN